MNKLNIDDKVKVIMPGSMADGATATVESMQKFPPDGKILYIGSYHKECPNGGLGYDTSVQFGEGQYEIVEHYSNGGNSVQANELAVTLKLNGVDEIKIQLSDLENQLDRISQKINVLEECK